MAPNDKMNSTVANLYGSGWPFPVKPFTSRAVMGVMGGVTRLIMNVFNTMRVYGPHENLLNALKDKKAVFTFSNHVSNVDDPSIWGITLRWVISSVDIVFTRPFHVWLFSNGQSIPIYRNGAGVYQRGMDFAVEKLNENEWLHIYPQGKCVLGNENHRFKWGMGRILADSIHKEVLLIPVYHVGMDDIMPMVKPFYPRIGQKVTILYGEPVKYGHILEKLKAEGASEQMKRKVITDLCQEKLYELRERAKQLHYEWTGIRK